MVYDLVDVVLDEEEEEVPSLRNTRLRVCVSCVCVMCVCVVVYQGSDVRRCVKGSVQEQVKRTGEKNR